MRRLVRRGIQLGALGLLLAVPALNYGGILYQQYGRNGYHKISLTGTVFEQWLYHLFSITLGRLPDPAVRSMDWVGNFGSFSIFGFPILDPVVAAETVFRAPGVWLALLAGAALPLLVAALLGRVFCGWVCPVNTLLEGFDLLRRRALPKIGVRPPDLAVPRWAKWALLFTGLAAAVAFDVALWANLLPHVQIGRDVFSLMVFGVTNGGVLIFSGVILGELLLSRRAWCRSLCPTGALLGLFGSLAPFRVRKAERACIEGCTACARICPMGVNPAGSFSLAECYNCGVCTAACPDDLLTLGFAPPHRRFPGLLRKSPEAGNGFPVGADLRVRPVVDANLVERLGRRRRSVGQPRGGATKDANAHSSGFFNRRFPARLLARLRKGVSLGLGTALLLVPLAASGHHMRGKPHYGYAENYPQIPTRETRVRVGRYDITVVSYFFEGLRRQTSDTPDDVQFYVSLTDAKTGQSYTGPLTIEVRRGQTRLAAFQHDRPLEEAVYRVRQSVPGPGLYDLRLVAEGFQGSVPVEVWGDTVSWMPYLATTGGVVLFVLLLFIHRRRSRAARRRKTHAAPGA